MRAAAAGATDLSATGWRSKLASGPHAGAAVALAGAPLERAPAALLLVHGRGASALDILDLGAAIAPAEWALVAPQATHGSWYPQRFLVPPAANEPWLSSALALLDEAADHLREAGIPAERLAVAGFSQGACLALEWTARRARRLAAVVGFSGALLGPLGSPRALAMSMGASISGSLAGTPILLCGAENDPHVPGPHLRESAELFGRLGAAVELVVAAESAHGVRREEMMAAKRLLGSV